MEGEFWKSDFGKWILKSEFRKVSKFCKVNFVENFQIELKWVPENLYTFTIWPAIEKVYIFSGTHFI